METVFDGLIDSYLQDQVGITRDFLSPALAASLVANLQARYLDHSFHEAGIGNDTVQNQDTKIRGDEILWLDRSTGNIAEELFFALLDDFVSYLNRTCYTGITGYEFHYARYDTGSFYTKHLDQFRNNSSRVYTMIMYLNPDWLASDGGELCIHHADRLQMIAPEDGKCVFFKSSEILHEVLLTHRPRLSITGWLKTGI